MEVCERVEPLAFTHGNGHTVILFENLIVTGNDISSIGVFNGRLHFDFSKENVDAKKAETENAKFSIGDFQGIMLVEQDPQKGGITENSTVMSNDPLFRFDDHNVHLETHRKFILSDEFSELPPEIQTQAIAHVALHQNMIAEEEKNAKPEPKDPREFVQMDKLYTYLTRKEQVSYLPSIGIEPDLNTDIVGVLTKENIFEAQQNEKIEKQKSVVSLLGKQNESKRSEKDT